MAAPPAGEERDALAACVILTRLFACRDVGDFPRRLTLVGLTGTRVAFGVGADLRPRTLNCCRVDERVVYVVARKELLGEVPTDRLISGIWCRYECDQMIAVTCG